MDALEEADPAEALSLKRSRKRAMIINEIMTSEAVYLNRLLTIRDVYLVPIREGNILSNAEYTGQFWQLESIYDLHVKLFEELSNDFNTGEVHVGKIFKDFSHFLKIYKQYLSCFAGGSMVKRAKLLTSNKKFIDFVNSAQQDPRCQGMPLDSYLIEPVQRIPRYCMLLDELLKYTDETHLDYDSLETAVINVRKVAVENNEAIRKQEEAEKIYQVMLQISSNSETTLLDDPNRRFLLQGDLVRQCRNFRKTFRFWLFSDKLLYGEDAFSAVREGLYTVNREILLSRCTIRSMDDTENNEYIMRVQSPAKSFLVYFKVNEERNKWVNAILAAIQASQCSVDKHGLAPVWAVDSSKTECELCFVKFTLLNRKHHCRKCGSIVCHECSAHKTLLNHVDANNEVRICDNCFVYKVGTLDMGIGTEDGDSNDYTVDLNRLVNKSTDHTSPPSTKDKNDSFSGRSGGNSKHLSSNFSSSTNANRSSTSSRYRDSLNNAEVKDIQAARRGTSKGGCLSYYLLCGCFCENEGGGERSSTYTDPLLTRDSNNQGTS